MEMFLGHTMSLVIYTCTCTSSSDMNVCLEAVAINNECIPTVQNPCYKFVKCDSKTSISNYYY